MEGSGPLIALVGLVMAIGVAGTVVPLVPGLWLVVAAAAGYGLVEGFGPVGVAAMVAIVALAVAGAAAGVALPGRAASRTGAPRTSILAGAVGAVIGFFVVPVVGLPLGGVLGIFVVERVRTGDGATAWRTTKATLTAFGVATGIQLAAGMAMVLVWIGWVTWG